MPYGYNDEQWQKLVSDAALASEIYGDDALEDYARRKHMAQVTKKLKTDIFDGELDANAHSIMGKFKKHAKIEGWSQEEIDHVLKEAMDGDYDHLIQTLMRYTD